MNCTSWSEVYFGTEIWVLGTSWVLNGCYLTVRCLVHEHNVFQVRPCCGRCPDFFGSRIREDWLDGGTLSGGLGGFAAESVNWVLKAAKGC